MQRIEKKQKLHNLGLVFEKKKDFASTLILPQYMNEYTGIQNFLFLVYLLGEANFCLFLHIFVFKTFIFLINRFLKFCSK